MGAAMAEDCQWELFYLSDLSRNIAVACKGPVQIQDPRTLVPGMMPAYAMPQAIQKGGVRTYGMDYSSMYGEFLPNFAPNKRAARVNVSSSVLMPADLGVGWRHSMQAPLLWQVRINSSPVNLLISW